MAIGSRKVEAQGSIISPNTLTTEQFAMLRRMSLDPFFFATFIYVIHPIKGKVPFILYPYQKKVLYDFLNNRFNIVLKFRQAGITELISLYCLWLAMFHPNKNILIISIKERVAKKVLRKIKYMYKNLPSWAKVSIANGRGSDIGTATELEFVNGSIITSIPTSEDAGRSEAVSLMVVDEAAILRLISRIWAAAFPTLSTGGAAIVNSCVTGDTEIITKNGPLRIDTICPKEFGRQNISHLGLEVLSHKGKWQPLLGSVNKGLLPTWEIENDRGKILKCTPDHKLLTTHGWKSVKEIYSKNLEAIFYDFKEAKKEITIKPVKEVFKPIKGFPNYQISNLGKVYIIKDGKLILKKGNLNNWGYYSIKLWNQNKSKKFQINRLVATHFIGKIPKGYVVDHIDCDKTHDYVTNLQIITVAENSKRGAKYSNNHSIGAARSKGKFADLQVTTYIQSKYKEYKGTISNFQDKIINEVIDLFGVELNRSYITKVGMGKRNSNTYLSKIKVNRKYMDYIYDISVAEDMSYFTNTEFVNHNTPYGVGNWYHKQWVDACAGSSNFNPIRLHWQMHPERDLSWYNTMRAELGPRKTAQEIDGDFLSSGNTVFDLSDIKAIEDFLDEYRPIETRVGGKLKIYKRPKPNTRFFIGADVATGRANDFSAFSVMDKTGEEYASFKGKIPVSRFAKLLMETGKEYNYALLGPESNDIGLAVTSDIEEAGYDNLLYSKKITRKRGKLDPEESDIPGWYTTKQNRPIIINELEEDIRKSPMEPGEGLLIKDVEFTREAYTFIYDSNGKPIAMGKNNSSSDMDLDLEGEVYNDDAIMAKGITNRIRKTEKEHYLILPR